MNLLNLYQVKGLLDRAGITVPPPIIRGLDLIDVVDRHEQPPTGGLLELTDAAARDRVTDLSIRSHQGFVASTRGMRPGIEDFKNQLSAEIREASLPYLDQILVDLQPRFDELAAPLITAAQTYGFTANTKSDYVIDLANEDASAAWRAGKVAWHAISPIVTLRTEISKAFDVSPTPEETLNEFWDLDRGGGLDYSVCFAAGDNWSYDGAYYLERKTGASIDWYALAAGGLHLNTPAEVREKQQAKSATLT